MDFQNGKSIFLQIADNIIDKIVSGALPAGEKIPSVRELASQMGVNPNTIMRSYSELQTRGIIENQRGIGYFVNPDAPKIITKSKREAFFQQVLPDFLKQANLLDISYEEIDKQIKKLN